MRSLSLTILLSAMLSPIAVMAAEQAEENDSYLPPASLRAAPQAAPNAHAQQNGADMRRRPVQTAHRRHEGRGYHSARYGGPHMFFGLF